MSSPDPKRKLLSSFFFRSQRFLSTQPEHVLVLCLCSQVRFRWSYFFLDTTKIIVLGREGKCISAEIMPISSAPKTAKRIFCVWTLRVKKRKKEMPVTAAEGSSTLFIYISDSNLSSFAVQVTDSTSHFCANTTVFEVFRASQVCWLCAVLPGASSAMNSYKVIDPLPLYLNLHFIALLWVVWRKVMIRNVFKIKLISFKLFSFVYFLLTCSSAVRKWVS